MVQLPVVYGEWVTRDHTWHFAIDNLKGGRIFTLHNGCTHRELGEMAQEDYMLDNKTELVELSYLLPETMLKQMGPDTPPIYLTNDRQVWNMVELASTHLVRLCVSRLNKMKMMSMTKLGDATAEDAEQDENDEVEQDENDEYDEEWNEEDADEDSDGSVCGSGVDDGIDNLDGKEKNFKKDDEAYSDGVDYSAYGKVKDEDVVEDEDYKNYELEGVTTRFVGRGGKSWFDGIFSHKCFHTKTDLQAELRLTAIMLKFAFKVDKSDKNLFVAICGVKECKWRLRAGVKNEPNKFWVTKYLNRHTCSVADRIAQHKRHTPKYIGWLFIECFDIIDGMTPKHIKASMKRQFGIKMNYTTAYRSLMYAQQLVRGSAEDGYERLPSYLHQIQLTNPGSITALELDDENRFKYLFLAFGASIHGFQYMRRVIVVDGTHLTGKYGGVMLVATAQDGNFQIFPLAFGIVDIENDASWEWFFTKLRQCISDEYPLVIVSDRHNSIKKACDTVFPWAQRGICYYHLQNNIVAKFKGKHLLYLVKNAAYAYTLYDFNRYMASLREINPDLANYMEEADVKLWSHVHFVGDRYNIKTSNIAESINSALKMARGFPISFLLQFIQEKLGNWFCKKRLDAMSLTTTFSRGVEYLMAIREHYADMMTAERIDGYTFAVRGGHRDCIVDLEHRTCSCGVWDYEKIPCSHAICAAPELELHPSTLVCQSYRREYLFTAYSRNIFPKNDDFKSPESVLVLPPIIKRPPGRQKKSRWQSWLEIAMTKGNKPRKLHKQYSCSSCKQLGHTRSHCETKPEND